MICPRNSSRFRARFVFAQTLAFGLLVVFGQDTLATESGFPACGESPVPVWQEVPAVKPESVSPKVASPVPESRGMWLSSLAIFLSALVLSLLLVPVAKMMAVRFRHVDHPDEKRKLHGTPIPLVGGIVIFVATLITAIVANLVIPGLRLREDVFSWKDLGLLISCSVILAVGILDDRFGMRGRQKLAGQFVAATILVGFGYEFSSLTALGFTIDLRFFSLVFVYGWILVGINSVNLLDGADGFASTIGFLMSAALCVMALFMGRFIDAVILAAAAGAILGFLRFNFPPASAYLGDAGSMLIGLFVAAMSIRCVSKQATLYAYLAPLALLAIPLVDTLAAIVRRRLTGRSVFSVDRGHLHHALIRKGFGPRKSLLMFSAMCLFTTFGGVLSLVYQESEYALISIAAVIIFLFVGKVFGLAEFQLIAFRSRAFASSFFVIPRKESRNPSGQASVRLQGTKQWDGVWKALCEFAQEARLSELSIDLNLPWLHESWFARYQQPDRRGTSTDDIWNADVPLQIDNRLIGRLKASAPNSVSPVFVAMAKLEKVLAELEPAFRNTIASQVPIEENVSSDGKEDKSPKLAGQPVDV
jgi:UDP-GlcNAc:undecaprenyl-phosphate/decaprenyl-phosphate GlcNAc-1-phosphate transferase